MSQSEENNFSNGDWENQSELYWSEQEWNHYLQQNAGEQARFLSLYSSLRNQLNHLDLTAKQMGWDTGDWAPADEDVFEEKSDEDSPVQWPPYCVEQHPVYIATRALCGLLGRELEHVCAASSALMPATLAVTLARGLNELEHRMIMSITAMDTADFSLALSLMKHAITEINRTMGLLSALPENDATVHFANEFRFVLFDLREICLRGINDSKWELDNPSEQD